MENDITGNRDAAYSKWHRATFPKKHTLIDNDLHDLNLSFVYEMYYNWDKDGDLIPKVIFETKGIIQDSNGLYILPDMSRHRTQILALRGGAKGNNIPAFMVFYKITDDIKFFVIVPLNKLAKEYFTKYNLHDLHYVATEIEYYNLLCEITGMTKRYDLSKVDKKELKFKDQLFKQTLANLNLK